MVSFAEDGFDPQCVIAVNADEVRSTLERLHQADSKNLFSAEVMGTDTVDAAVQYVKNQNK